MKTPAFPLDWLAPALDACRAEISRQRSPGLHVAALRGSGEDQVTALDLQVEQILITAIAGAYPEAAIVSEETRRDSSALTSPLCFVIDPIDGTKELVAGTADFAISIGVFRDGDPLAGILDFPVLDLRFTCQTGEGAEVNGKPLPAVDSGSAEHSLVATSMKQLGQARYTRFWNHLHSDHLVAIGALTPKVASVLTGRCTAAIDLPSAGRRAYVWDYAAAAMLLREVGGTLISFTGVNLLDELPFSHEGGWLAGTRSACTELRAVWAASDLSS
jgi:myo-inositol-1(or 4)-monophosphatase